MNDQGSDGRLLKEQLQLVKVPSGKDGKSSRYQVRPLTRQLSFDKGFYVCLRALQLLAQHNSGCIIVGVAGASGSGKTTFTRRLQRMMQNIQVLSMDMYNDGSKVVENNFDDPRICDYDLLLSNIADLRAGRATRAPIYDFKESCRTGFHDVEVPASRVIIIEGIYALSQRIAQLLDLKIAVTGGVHFDLVKRVMRDIQRSGQGASEVIQQVSDTVYPMYKAFIEPDLEAAHIKVLNTFNPFAGFKEPIQILKTDQAVSVDDARRVLSERFPTCDVTQEAEIEVHDIFLLPPGEDPQGCQSWLRMRNQEGRYSLMFAEYIVSDPLIVSPRVSFEVPVRILGGLMALGYTIGSIMSRTSFRLVAGPACIKWDRIDRLGHFVQVQGERRDDVMAICERLDVTHFIPRSYIEQVQLLRLTEHFAEMTDAARRHFTVGEDTIIDDHVIGASPARRLNAPSAAMLSLRHSSSTLGAVAATAQAARVTSEPLKQAVGWASGAPHHTASPIAGAGASRSSSRELADARAAAGPPPPPGPSQLSRDMEALSLEGRRSGSSAKLREVVQEPGGMQQRPGDAPGTPSPRAPPGSSRGGGGPLTLCAPDRHIPAWVPHGTSGRALDVAALSALVHADLQAIASAVAASHRWQWYMSLAASACAGVAAGATLALLIKRS